MSEMTYEGTGVLVTGASSGIGAELAEALAARGAVVGICARREDRLAAVLQRCRAHSSECRMWVADLADPAQVDRLAKVALEELGRIDLLVNNAGMPKRRTVQALDIDTVEAVMRLNFLSPVQLALALVPHMVERGSGVIVNMSSVAALLSSPGEAAYDASKAALSVFGEAMALDLWETGVKVLNVYPGLIDTELIHAPDNDELVAGIEAVPASDVVDAILRALDAGAPEVFEPTWFHDIVVAKAGDTAAYLKGAADYLRTRELPTS
ncbi:MAG: short-chain dehydrogenase Adh 1 [Actinomycetia bacterium]|nr:short-chain dehydrogenase Adh 1 [Actinomycetes bacterium]